MPRAACPHPLYAVAFAELRKDGVYPVAKPAQEGAPLRGRVLLLGGVRGQKLDAHRRQLLLGLGRVIVAVPDDQPGGVFDEFGDDRELVDVGRGHRDAGDYPGPANPHVYSEALKGLFEQGVLTESGLSLKAPAAVGSGEQARRQGHRVADGEGGVVGSLGQELLAPEALLDLPEEVGRLPSEGGAVHTSFPSGRSGRSGVGSRRRAAYLRRAPGTRRPPRW